jgi:TonB family protein
MLMLLTSCRRATPYLPGRSANAGARRAIVPWLVAAASSLASLSSVAQTTPSPSEVAPSERAKRDADKVFHWIIIQGDRTRKASAPAAKDVKDAKDDRPAARPSKVAAPDAAPARPKADATVAAAESASPPPAAAKSASKPAEKPVDATAAASAAPVPMADAPKPDEARLARVDPAPRDAAPAVQLSEDAPQGLVVVEQPAPQFPVNVMRNLRQGTVQVQFSVLTDGSVANPEVLKTTNSRLNAAALDAVSRWRFQPVSKVQTGAVEVGFNLE